MRSAKATNVDLEGWAHEILEKLTGKPHHRSRSSVSSQILFQHVRENSTREAPPRPISRDSPSLAPPRRPSTAAGVAEQRRPSAASIASVASDRSGPSNPFPARTSSHTHTHTSSQSSTSERMQPPPRPVMLQKSFTESTATPAIEAHREREKLDRERELEARREREYRQGTIGIGFQGGTIPPPPPGGPPPSAVRPEGSSSREGSRDLGRSDLPEMRERRRPPPMVTMSTSGNGVGVTNGGAPEWPRRRAGE